MIIDRLQEIPQIIVKKSIANSFNTIYKAIHLVMLDVS